MLRVAMITPQAEKGKCNLVDSDGSIEKRVRLVSSYRDDLLGDVLEGGEVGHRVAHPDGEGVVHHPVVHHLLHLLSQTTQRAEGGGSEGVHNRGEEAGKGAAGPLGELSRLIQAAPLLLSTSSLSRSFCGVPGS